MVEGDYDIYLQYLFSYTDLERRKEKRNKRINLTYTNMPDN